MMGLDNILLFLVFLPIFFSTLTYIRKIKSKKIIFLTHATLITFSVIALTYVVQNGYYSFTIGGWPEGIGISLHLNVLTAVMIFLTTFLFLFYFIYEWDRLSDHPLLVLLLFILESLTCALFMTNDLFNLYVLLEVSTIIVTILIMYNKKPIAYYDTLIYMLTNIVGMSFYLLGLGFVYRIYGTFDMTLLRELVSLNPLTFETVIPYALILTGISFKLGLMPVFTWKIRATSSLGTPAVVGAILSSVYINLGFVFYLKIQAIWENVINTNNFFIILSILTIIISSFLAITQVDLKKLLAYSTVSQVGFIMLGLNLNSPEIYNAMLFHIASHAIFKSLLFLAAGILISHFGTTHINNMGAVLERIPFVGYTMLIGILGLAGAPLLNGSIAKYVISNSLHGGYWGFIIYLVQLLTIMYCVKLIAILFGGSKKSYSIPLYEKIPLFTLAIITVLTGIFAPTIFNFLFSYKIKISFFAYIQKFIIFISFIIFSIIFYKRKLMHSPLMRKFRHTDLQFNLVVSMIFSLFIMILSYSTYLIM